MPYDIIIGRTEVDREKFGKGCTILLGKQYVKMAQTTSLSNEIFLDVSRSHVVFVCGKRGCLTEGSMIFTNKGYKKLKNFDEKKDKIYSFNLKKKVFEWESAKLLSYTMGNEDLYQIGLLDGQTLELTSEHPLLVCNKGFTWKIASEIKKGDKIVGIYYLPNIHNDAESLRIARLLGFILSDGTIQKRRGVFKDGRGYFYKGTKARLRIFNAEHRVLDQAKDDLEKEFSIKVKKYERPKYNSWVIETKHQKVLNKFVKLGVPLGKKSYIIRVPDIVFRSSNKFKAEFLKALFSCDGFVDKNGSRIMYYSNSKEFITDLQLLFAHFSIQSRMRIKKTTCNGKRFISYLLDIMDYTSMKNFQKKVGFYNEEKNKRLKKRKFSRMKRRKSTIYIDNKLFCLDVVNINKIKGINKVYDLAVPKNNSFIANGIISHNSGKSYTMGVVAEGISDLPVELKDNIAVIMLDTMGVYWTMKYANKKDSALLEEWGFKGKSLDIHIYTPIGYYKKFKEQGIPTDFPFSIRPSELTPHDWCLTFDVSINSQHGVLIERVTQDLIKENPNFSIDDIIKKIKGDERTEQHVKDFVENRFISAKNWGLFSKEGTPIEHLVSGGQVTVIDVSCYATIAGAEGLKSLVIGLIAQKLFIRRMISRKMEEYAAIKKSGHYLLEDVKEEKLKQPLIWLIIDEAHEFLPNEGKTSASSALLTILREGRQPGISLILASQQPGKIHTDVMTQSDVVISHRITAKVDVDALGMLMQSYMREGLDKQLNYLPAVKGAAIIFDDINERIYPMRVRPRFTWHGGEAPSAIKEKKKIFEF